MLKGDKRMIHMMPTINLFEAAKAVAKELHLNRFEVFEFFTKNFYGEESESSIKMDFIPKDLTEYEIELECFYKLLMKEGLKPMDLFIIFYGC